MKHSRFYQTIVATAIMLMGWLPLLAHDFEVDGIYYNILSNNNVEVTYKGSYFGNSLDYEGDVVIPKTVTLNEISYSVTRIGFAAFNSCSNLTSIEFPNSITYIGLAAFQNCTSLASVEIPNSVTEIDNSAFEWCISLTNIEIPNSVTEIGDWAFSNCTSLANIEIPNSVTYIGGSAFAHCTSLTSIMETK